MHLTHSWQQARTKAIVAGLCSAVAICPRSVGAQQQATFRAATQGVLVDTEVTRDGSPYGLLNASDFEVFDNGVRQTIDVSHSADAPVNVVLALDTSASTTGKRLDDLQSASRVLLDGLKPGDHAGLTTFNAHVMPRVALTTDIAATRAALNQIVPSGDTAMFDGVYAALLTTAPAVGASLVVVCTDGADTASWLEKAEVLEAASRLDAVLYAVVIHTAHRWTDLKDIVESTGGRVVEIGSTGGLASEFASILRDFRSRYQITFTPSGVASGGYHRLEVRVHGSGLKVHARAGYSSDSKVR